MHAMYQIYTFSLLEQECAMQTHAREQLTCLPHNSNTHCVLECYIVEMHDTMLVVLYILKHHSVIVCT